MTMTLDDPLTGFATVDDVEQELIRLEGLVSQVRARQCELLAEVDRLDVPRWDGTRSLKEWIAGRLDVHPRTAGDLSVLTKSEPGPIRDAHDAGLMTTDRAAGMTRLANSGADPATLHRAEGVAVGQLGRVQAQHRRMAVADHHAAFRSRRLFVQPNLTNMVATGSFTMSGADVDLFLEALDRRADDLVDERDPLRPRLEQRRVDALVSLALDAVAPDIEDRHSDEESKPGPAPRRIKAHIFVEAGTCRRTSGEAGAVTRFGLEVGPNTLEEIFCSGDTHTTVIEDGRLLRVRTDGDRIPRRTREFVFFRDGGCTADGCTSRYRLEPHHIRERSRGGSHDPDNLTLLCWFHHHVVIHQLGYRIDERSAPGRIRFIPGDVRPDPPDA